MTLVRKLISEFHSQLSILEKTAYLEYLFLRGLTIFLLGKVKGEEFFNRGIIDINYFMCRHHLLRGIGYFKIINRKEGFGVGNGLYYIVPIDALGVPAEVKRVYIKPNKNEIVIDVGAHYGFFTLYASQLVGEQGKIIAFEPHPYNYKKLLENLQKNKIKNVKAFSKALGDFDGSVRLYIRSHSDGHSTLFKTKNYINVKMRKIDSVVDKIGLKRVDLIKIDAEGDELSIIKGATETIKKHKPKITLAAYHFPNEIDKIKDWFEVNNPSYNIITINNRYVHSVPSEDVIV